MQIIKIIFITFTILIATACGNKTKTNTEQPTTRKITKDTLININRKFVLLFLAYDEQLQLWYEPYIVNKQTNDTLRISGLSYENGSELDVRISPNEKFFVLDNIIKGYVETEDGKKLHENFNCVIIDVEKATVVEAMQSGCGGEWDSDNNWVYGESTLFSVKPKHIKNAWNKKSQATNIAISIPEGNYQSDNKACKINITIMKNRSYSIYVDGKNTKNGVYKISSIDQNDVYVSFGNISAMYDRDKTISIQNYGNAMNEYTHFESCDAKYITLIRKK